MRTQIFGALAVLAVLAVGCGPRLKKADDASAASTKDVPVAKMVVQIDPAKLDATKKLAADGDFKVSGLFYKGTEPLDATVKVKLYPKDGAVYRDYVVDVESVRGAAAKVEMWDDGTLTVVVPDSEAPVPGFETSNPNIKAVGVELPGGTEQSTCYFAKQILETSIRFALCDLGGNGKPPSLHFVDAAPDAPTEAPPAAGELPAAEGTPAAGAAPAPAPAPAAK
ncbi:MAG: hypothetical protein RL033_3229 [Pseudomonadota bacterium]|jgi:hypothetical protein